MVYLADIDLVAVRCFRRILVFRGFSLYAVRCALSHVNRGVFRQRQHM
jgi:hypothetical protein